MKFLINIFNTVLYIADPIHDRLLRSAEARIATAYRPGTVKNQKNILYKYIRISLWFGYDFKDPSYLLAIVYIEYLAQYLKTSTSVFSTLASLKALLQRLQINIDSFHHQQVSALLLSISKNKRTETFQRPPASIDTVKTILQFIASTKYGLQLSTAILLMFTTNMRQANLFPYVQKEFDPDRMLLRSDVQITHDTVVIKNKWSKSSQQITSLRYQHIPKAADERVCLWTAMSTLFQTYPHVSLKQPLFHFHDLTPMTTQYVNRAWKEALKATDTDSTITLHSLRRGGALYLQQNGVPLPDVGTHGGWKSNAVLRYTNHPSSTSAFSALQALQ